MKTNQIMKVILLDQTLEIGHLDHFGSLKDIFLIGNKWRALNDRKVLRHDQWLALEGTKNFIESVSKKIGEPATRSKSGKSGGIWAHLYILLDAASYLSPELKLEVYDKFIEGKLLEWRDRSGDNFIELNASIALAAEDVFGKPSHRGHYITLAKIIKQNVKVEDWNLADASQLHNRSRIEEALATMLKTGVVRDWDHLKKLAKIV
jgi:hypothetical protein